MLFPLRITKDPAEPSGVHRRWSRLKWVFDGLLVTIALSTIIAAFDPTMKVDFTPRAIKELLHKTAVSSAVWSPNGKQIATLSDFFRRVTVWDAETGVLVSEFMIAKGPPACTSLAFTRDGKSIVTTADSDAGSEAHAAVALWDATTGELQRYVPGPFPDKGASFNAARVFAISRSGEELALRPSSARTDEIAVYSGENWTSQILFPIQADVAEAIAFSPSEHRLAIGTIAGRLLVFDLTGHKEVWSSRLYEDDSGGVSAVEFSPDGTSIAAGFTGPLNGRRRPNGSWESSTVASPLAVWDARTGKLVRALTGSTQKIKSVSWSADGSTLAAAQDDNSVRFWSIASPDRPAQRMRIAGPVGSVAFAPNASRFVIAGNKVVLVGEIVTR